MTLDQKNDDPYHQIPPLKYLTGELIEVGDKVKIADVYIGFVTELYYNKSDFESMGLDKPGIMVHDDRMGDVYWHRIDEDLVFVTRRNGGLK